MLYKDHKKELSGQEDATTNQRMELKAVIEALKALKVEGWDIEIYSDSAYIVNAFEQNWIGKWMRNGWKTSKKEPVANQDLWEELIALCRKNHVVIKKVKGHSGDEYNERCDQLARKAIQDNSKK